MKTERVQAGASLAVFRDNIQKLVDRLEGGVGGVLMGFDGITVDSYVREVVATGVADIQSIGLDFTHLTSQARRTAASLDLGALRELSFTTAKVTVLVQGINKDYFIACAFRTTGDPSDDAAVAGRLGKARYLMRLTAPQIEAQL